MKLLKNHTFIHGFEDYNIVYLNDTCFYRSWGFYLPYNYCDFTSSYIINKDLPVRVSKVTNPTYDWMETICFSPEIAVNHKELLDTAKKVFTHPSCKLSRSMMGEKYKKSLNPFLSDAIVIPKPNYSDLSLKNYALFINENAKIIVMIWVEEPKAHNHIKDVCEGTKFKDIITCSPDDNYGSRKPYNTSDMLDAELFYYGEVLYIPNEQSWIAEVLTHRLPPEKIVFEESIQESLGDETNQLDFDSLCSIKDMLESSDENTVSAGLKSLSMMDWMHYPQSVKFILNNVDNKYHWIYNKACNSTSVKYMMKTIAGEEARRRTWWPGGYDNEIYEKDFELFKQLKCHYDKIPSDQIMNNLRYINFMKVSAEGFITPNLKQTA